MAFLSVSSASSRGGHAPRPHAAAIAFKGLDARPLQSVVVDCYGSEKQVTAIKHLQQLGKEEGFQVFAKLGTYLLQDLERVFTLMDDLFNHSITKPEYWDITQRRQWGQDNKLVVIGRNGQREILKLPTLPFRPKDIRKRWDQGVVNNKNEQRYADELGQSMGLPVRPIRSYIEGGNLFLGTRLDGSPYGLVGHDSVEITALLLAGGHDKTPADEVDQLIENHYQQALQVIAEDLNLDPANLGVIHQPDFHLDMRIRPLKYPFVLLHDDSEAIPFLDRVLASGRLKGDAHSRVAMLRADTRQTQRDLKQKGYYADTRQTEAELKALGFEPIRVPAVFGKKKGRLVNYMNALVHENPAKQGLVYATGSCSLPEINKAFAEALRQTLPPDTIRRIEFIAGSYVKASDTDADDYGPTNHLESELTQNEGGLHCQCLEIP